MLKTSGVLSETVIGKNARAFRRVSHGLLCLSLGYYFVPIEFSVPIVVALSLSVGVMEAFRISTKTGFFGIAEFERTTIAGYAYSIWGASLLLLFFDKGVAVPCICGMALVDPLSGELRRKCPLSVSIGISSIAYFGIVVLVSAFLGPNGLIVASVATPVAIISEVVYVRYLNDDILMLILPAIAASIFI